MAELYLMLLIPTGTIQWRVEGSMLFHIDEPIIVSRHGIIYSFLLYHKPLLKYPIKTVK